MLRITSIAAAAAFLGYAGLALAQQPSTSPYYPNRYTTRAGTGMSTMPERQSTAPWRQTMPRREATATAGQFASEAEARSRCMGDTVVWVNTKSHVYHFPGSRDFGQTKHGAFMCRADADRAGSFRAAKGEVGMQRNTELNMQRNTERAPSPRFGSSFNRY